MALTHEQHLAVFRILADEENKARKAVAKAQTAYDNAPIAYGGSVERETAAVLLNLRAEQYMTAQRATAAYFDAYIKDAA
jgi:hypothetical protein